MDSITEQTKEKQIDVLVPVFNRGEFVHPFIELLKKQSFKNFALYFACGESQDDTDEQLTKAVQENPEIVIKVAKVGAHSIGRLRNYWLDSGELQGEYVAYLDIDDQFDPEFLQRLYRSAEENHSDVVQCAFKRIDPKTGKTISIDMAHNPEKPLQNPLEWTNIVFLHTGAPAKLFRRSILTNEVRFADEHRFEDVAFVLRALAIAHSISFVNEPLYYYTISQSSVSTFVSKEAVDNELKDAQNILLGLKDFYVQRQPQVYREGFVDALAFLRYGIGLTTRACLSGYVRRHKTIKSSKLFLDSHFPLWRSSQYLARKNTKSFGRKTGFVQWCRFLYRCDSFGLFVFAYDAYTRLLRKDIKP